MGPLSDLSCPSALCVVTDPVGWSKLPFKLQADDVRAALNCGLTMFVPL